MKKTFKKIILWLMVAFWFGVIFYFSQQPYLRSNLPGEDDFICRKIAHISEFFVFAYFTFRALELHYSKKKALFWTLILVLFTAIFDETHQIFIPGRHPCLRDVIFDFSGGSLLCFFEMERDKFTKLL